MAQNLDFYYPFDSIKGDRVTTAATERRFFHDLYSDGVIGSDAFAIRFLSDGVFAIGEGTAMIGGAIGGLISERQIEAKPASGVTTFIVLRLETRAEARKISLDVVSSPLTDTTQSQLDEGGVLDLVLYSVTGQTGGGYGVLDQRKQAASFDNASYSAKFVDMLSKMEANGTSELNALSSLYRSAISESNAENAGLYGSAGRQGFINPTFIVNQRGSVYYSLTSGSAYTFDHWKAVVQTRSLSSAMSIQRDQDGARHAMRIDVPVFASGGSVGRVGIVQNIENGVRTFGAGGKTFTVSFDAKAAKDCRIGVDANQIAMSGGSGVELSRVVNISTSWERYSVTFTGSVDLTAEQITNVLQIGFYFLFTGYTRYKEDQNVANTIWLANMQINEGAAALPCYVRPYADELEACQRYFVKLGYVSLSVGATLASLNQVISSPLPITRRLYRMPTATPVDRAGVSGKASVEAAAGGWRNGLACSISNNSTDAPVFVVTNTDASAVTRINFNSLELDAEIAD